MKIGIFAGHLRSKQGADSRYGTEFKYWRHAQKFIQSEKHELVIFKRISSFKKLAKDMIDMGIHNSIELHFNAGGGTGPEVLFYQNEMRLIAAKMSSKMANYLSLPNRGAKELSFGDRGYANLTRMFYAGVSSLILEPCFNDDVILGNYEAVAKAVSLAIDEI